MKPEEARKQVVLVVDSPIAGKAEAFPQPEHRLETCNGSPRRVEGMEAADLRHVLLHAEMVAFDALREMIGDIVEGIRTQEAAANRRFDCGRNVLAPSVPIFPGDIRG
jgi:hypothetical protein